MYHPNMTKYLVPLIFLLAACGVDDSETYEVTAKSVAITSSDYVCPVTWRDIETKAVICEGVK